MFELIMDMVVALGEDVIYFIGSDDTLYVTIEDFMGFDDDYEEVERELIDAIAVKTMMEYVKAHCLSYTEHTYIFKDFTVVITSASDDI